MKWNKSNNLSDATNNLVYTISTQFNIKVQLWLHFKLSLVASEEKKQSVVSYKISLIH